MSDLQTFRSRLAKLKNLRALTRWQTAIARCVVLDVAAAFVVFAIDFSLGLGTVPRAVLIGGSACGLVWQACKIVLPYVSIRESVTDIALLLERTQRVDSDLVAALQFEGSAQTIVSSNLGSAELRLAVVQQGDAIAKTLDYDSVCPRREVRRATWAAAGSLLAVVVVCSLLPAHAKAFGNRLLLGDAAYPTRTVIDHVKVNGRSREFRVVEGEPMVLQVTCSGVTPETGSAVLRGHTSGDTTTVRLIKSQVSDATAIYMIEGPQLNEPVEVTISIGDAEVHLANIELIQRPIVELTITATAPAYMDLEVTQQREHFANVMEGSAVDFRIECTNGKRLESVRLEEVGDVADSKERLAWEFKPQDAGQSNWLLTANASGVNRVMNDFRFRVFVVDEDGLGTYHPIEGAVRVKRDRAPSATIGTSQFVVTAEARPTIGFTVEDDFGVGSIKLHARRATSQTEESVVDSTDIMSIPIEPRSRNHHDVSIEGEQALDLRPLKLAAGDQVSVWLEVVDARGEWPGVSTVSEAIEMEVMSHQDVLNEILRSDADAEQLLTDAIENELGLRRNQ